MSEISRSLKTLGAIPEREGGAISWRLAKLIEPGLAPGGAPVDPGRGPGALDCLAMTLWSDVPIPPPPSKVF